MDDYEPRREPGSRVSVLLLGVLIGAILITILWLVVSGNPLSDANEVVYEQITVTEVGAEQDSICWSVDPRRRDAERTCAILALDPEQDTPQAGDTVLLGYVMLQPPGEEETRQAVYVELSVEPSEPAPTFSD